MRCRQRTFIATLLALAFPGLCPAADNPSPVAATRPELKEQLERSKQSQPRLPLPPPTEEEIAAAKARTGQGPMGGIINNGRMRKRYLPPELLGGGFTREPDPAMTLSPAFKTMFFWIVSRANNCTYCQGHQEVKLTADGVKEDTIAALDGDWSEFTEAGRAAFAFTKKLTYEPHAITDRDVDRLRAYFTAPQILEIVLTVAGNNAMNRWTGSLAIPQEEHRVYLTPTPAKFETARSLIAPLDPSKAESSCALPARRGSLPSHEETEAALAACRKRMPRLPLVEDSQARSLLPADFPSGPLPEWVRLLTNFPKAGKDRVLFHRTAEEKGRLDAKLKAKISWVAARHDRAWYALGHAKQRLLDLGFAEDAIYALDDPNNSSSPGERAALALAKKLTVDPALISDDDILAVRKQFNDFETAELVFQITEAAFFDRLTEACGLRLEEGTGDAARRRPSAE